MQVKLHNAPLSYICLQKLQTLSRVQCASLSKRYVDLFVDMARWHKTHQSWREVRAVLADISLLLGNKCSARVIFAGIDALFQKRLTTCPYVHPVRGSQQKIASICCLPRWQWWPIRWYFPWPARECLSRYSRGLYVWICVEDLLPRWGSFRLCLSHDTDCQMHCVTLTHPREILKNQSHTFC